MPVCRILLLLLLVAGCAPQLPSARQVPAAGPIFVYDDVDRFGAALRAIDSGVSPLTAFETYLADASPAFPFFAERYDVTAQSIAEAVARRPLHYRRVSTLRPDLEAFEPVIARGLARLGRMAPGHDPAPVYYLVANLRAGGTPSELRPPVGDDALGIAVAVESIARSEATDMSEFPGTYSGGYLADIPYVVVHEMVHVYQARTQGLDNYRSIYRPGPNSSYLAVAVREGCADYLTTLATGRRRTGDQQSYGLANEGALWRQFRQVMDRPASFADGWFGALDPRTPDWPPQIGYWLGSRICRAYHREQADQAKAMSDILGAYRAEDMRRFAEAYQRQIGE